MQNLGSHHGGLLPKGQQLFLNSPSTPKPHSVNTSGQAVAGMPLMTPPATPRFKVQHQNEPEEVNVEYLKNVLLNFMEHKERRVRNRRVDPPPFSRIIFFDQVDPLY